MPPHKLKVRFFIDGIPHATCTHVNFEIQISLKMRIRTQKLFFNAGKIEIKMETKTFAIRLISLLLDSIRPAKNSHVTS